MIEYMQRKSFSFLAFLLPSLRHPPLVRTVLRLLIGGVLMGLAPVNAWPLAWIAMVPLWFLLNDAVAGRYGLAKTVLLAGVWGVGYHGVALWWITHIHPMMWMGVPWLGSIAIAFSAWAFITLWGAAIGMTWAGLMIAVSRYHRAHGIAWTLVGTALWCAVEWVWSKGPLYWTSLSYTQSPGNLWVLQLGQLAGPIVITASIVAVNGLIAQAIERFDTNAAIALWMRVVAFFVAVHVVGLSLYSFSAADAGTAVNIGLIQGNIPTDEKLSAAGIRASRSLYLQGYEDLAQQGADMVITPEGAVPQVWDAFLQDQNPFVKAVVRRGVPLVLGTFVRREIESRQGPITQSLIALSSEGNVVGRYNKVKLVPLGEYMPFADAFGGLIEKLSPFSYSMVPGSFSQRLETPLGPMAAGICYESAFTSLFRQQVNNGGEIVFTASNNDPYPLRQMRQHHAQDVMRAVETNRWMVRVTNTGVSGVVDPKGHTLWVSEPNEYVTHIAQVYRRRSRTLYVRFGDWLTPSLLIISAIVIMRLKRAAARL